MKKIMAGDGNIYCMIGGSQFQCDNESLILCLDACVGIEDQLGDSCGGCAQFPEVNQT